MEGAIIRLSSAYEQNPANFIVTLPRKLQFTTEGWSAALTELTIPQTWRVVPARTADRCILVAHTHGISTIYLPDRHYKDIDDVCQALNAHTPPPDGALAQIMAAHSDSRAFIGERAETPLDFRLVFSVPPGESMLILVGGGVEGVWMPPALRRVLGVTNGDRLRRDTPDQTEFYASGVPSLDAVEFNVHTSLIRPAILSDTMLPVARQFTPKLTKYGSRQTIEFKNLQYFPLSAGEFTEIEVSLRLQACDRSYPVEFRSGCTSLTFHLARDKIWG